MNVSFVVVAFINGVGAIYYWRTRRSAASTAQAVGMTLWAVGSLLLVFTRTQMLGGIFLFGGLIVFGISFWLADRALSRYCRQHPLKGN